MSKARPFVSLGFVVLFFVVCHMFILNSYFRFSSESHEQAHSVHEVEFLLVSFVLTNDYAKNQALIEDFLDEFNSNASQTHHVHMESSFSAHPLYTQHFLSTQGVAPIVAYLSQHETTEISIQLSPTRWFNLAKQETDGSYIFIVTLTFVESLIILTLFFYVFGMVRFSLPLKRFKASAESFGIQLQKKPLHSIGPRIVQEAAHAMNQMQERIEELIKRRTHMLATITHDLRTPITRLKIRAQCADNEIFTEQVIPDLEEMESMITSVLEFTRDESQAEQIVKFDLNALFFVVCEEAMTLDSSLQVIAEPARVIVEGRRLALKRALHNLLENAMRYAKEISASLDVNEREAIITIADRGPGIPENELDKVFEPYYRGDAGKYYSSVGTGLGLASVKMIITQHRGSVTLKNRDGGGLIVTLILPLTKETK